MRTQKTLVILVMVGSMMLVACASTNPLPVALNETSWTLVTLNGQSVIPSTVVTFNLENGKISGTDGCNRYGTSYTVSGNNFTADKNVISTKMACPPPIMQQANAYITALTNVATYKSDGQQLTLFDASGKTLAFFTVQSSNLGGTSWIVTGYNNGRQAVVSVIAGSKLTADFSADGKLNGSAGCNSYSATYQVSGKAIKISQGLSTLKACAEPAGVMEQETQYLKTLETIATYRIEGNQLELRTADGALAVTFEKVR